LSTREILFISRPYWNKFIPSISRGGQNILFIDIFKNKVHRTDLMYTLKWMFSKAIIKARLQGIIKVIRNPHILGNFIKRKIQEIKR
jgi:hypothetical protein